MKIRLSLWFSETEDALHSPGNFIFTLFIIGSVAAYIRGMLHKFGRSEYTFFFVFFLFIARLFVTKKAVRAVKNILKQRWGWKNWSVWKQCYLPGIKIFLLFWISYSSLVFHQLSELFLFSSRGNRTNGWSEFVHFTFDTVLNSSLGTPYYLYFEMQKRVPLRSLRSPYPPL